MSYSWYKQLKFLFGNLNIINPQKYIIFKIVHLFVVFIYFLSTKKNNSKISVSVSILRSQLFWKKCLRLLRKEERYFDTTMIIMLIVAVKIDLLNSYITIYIPRLKNVLMYVFVSGQFIFIKLYAKKRSF